jgi:hypothetical protein
MMLTEEQQMELINLSNQTLKKIKDQTELLAKGEERLKTNTKLLQTSTEDIHVLLAFIKSKNLQPPTIQSDFIN